MEPIELTMLEVIRQYEVISQRDISNKIGISLGTVNLLIHKFVKVGLIKVVQLNGKKVQYILTPNGISVLSKKTIEYISKSYTAVIKIKGHMSEVLRHHFKSGETVIVYGSHDEIFAILIEVIKELGLKYEILNNIEESTFVKFVHWDAEISHLGYFLLGDL